jgi:hypothetical protein
MGIDSPPPTRATPERVAAREPARNHVPPQPREILRLLGPPGLNIDIICASTPQAKGRVERMNKTLRVDLGPTGPIPPLDYTFTAKLGSVTTTHVATVDCYLDLPIGVTPAPGAPVPSPVTIGWMRPPGKTGIQYNVAVSGPESKTASVVDQSSALMYLLPGDYLWQIAAVPIGLHDGSSALKCGSEWSAGSFTVQ